VIFSFSRKQRTIKQVNTFLPANLIRDRFLDLVIIPESGGSTN